MGEPIYFGSCLSRETLAVSRGTETSKYPEESKSNETPLVAASERGSAQTLRTKRTEVQCLQGVVGPSVSDLQRSQRVTKRTSSRTVLERLTAGGESPVDERCATLRLVPEYDGTREILSEPGGTTLQG